MNARTDDPTPASSPADRRAPRRRRGVRWWPLLAVVGVAAVGIAVTRAGADADRQSANLQTTVVVVLASALAAIWFLWFSRLPTRVRATAGLAGLAAVLVFLIGFRLRGVTGDLLPIFEWRFRSAAPHAASSDATPDTTSDTTSDATSDATADTATDVAIAPQARVGTPPDFLEPVPGLADYPQFFGPTRDGELGGPRLARDWTARPPRELWRRELGAAWSGFAVAGRRAITQEQHGEDEAVVCYDVPSGVVLWVQRVRARYETTLAGVGPRATPTIDGERVYAQGATGVLRCLDLATGEVVWTKNILEDNGATLPEWGVAGSPLVVGTEVVVCPGGPGRSLVAYDKATGAFSWGGGSDRVHYSSPVLADLAGVRQVLSFNASVLAAHAVPGGEVLWTHPWKTGHPRVCLPLALDRDRVFVSSGYGTGCQLLAIERDPGDGALRASSVWRSLSLKAKFTNVVEKDGFVYGLDDGTLVCVDLRDGRRRWKRGRYGHGQVVLVGELLLLTAESGAVVLIEPVPDEPRELTRFEAFDAKTWNPPALAGQYLLVRNDREAACFRLPVIDDG